MAPRYLDLSGIVDIEPKPPLTWIHGANDLIVSDTSFFDLNYLGELGVIPGWPGAEVAPAQPMITQTRRVFEAYAAAGGTFQELVWRTAGTRRTWNIPEAFRDALVATSRPPAASSIGTPVVFMAHPSGARRPQGI
jgi:hypothetical protein